MEEMSTDGSTGRLSISAPPKIATRSKIDFSLVRLLSIVWFRLMIPLLLATSACAFILFARYELWSGKLLAWAGVSAVLLVTIIWHLRLRNSGIVAVTALFLSVQLIVIELLPCCPIPRAGNFENLLPVLLPMLLGALTIEGVLILAHSPKWHWIPFTLRELVFVLLAAGACFIVLMSFSLMDQGGFSAALTIFFITMTILFARFLVDKFGTVLLIFLLLSLLTAVLNTHLLTSNLFKTQTATDIVAIGWIVGIAVEGSVAVFSLKNVLHAFKAGRPGQVNSAFIQSSGHLSKAIVFALIAPSLTLLLTLDEPVALETLTALWIGTTFACLGGITSAFMSRDVNRWSLVGLLRPTFQQIWMREFNRWICSCAIGDIDDDGVNEIIVGCADYSIYCFRNGTLVWRTSIGNTPSPTCAIGYVGACDQKKFAVGCYDGNVYCLSPKGEVLWKTQSPGWIWCCAIGDADNDGENEVVAGGMDEKIHCYKDGGDEIWFMWFDSWLGCCAVGDADNDGLNEVVAGSNDQTLRCLKDGPNEIWRAWFGEWVTGVAIGDVDNDGLNEVVAGSFDGTLRCYRNGVEIWRGSILGTIGAVAIGDVDGDGLNEVVIGCGDNTVRVYKLGKEVWVAGLDKYPDCVAVGDVDNDGQNEILSGDWSSYLRCFKSTRPMGK